jgi:hypothetical protein
LECGFLATVDTLITAGIAGSRAEVQRWAGGRIRESPAYAQLQDRVRENPDLPERRRDHETMISELQHELEEKFPGASRLEFWFGENGRRGKSPVPRRTDPAASKQDLTPAHTRLGPADPEMLDVLITTGTAATRAETVNWVLARIRERPAYARLAERARELDQLKAHF